MLLKITLACFMYDFKMYLVDKLQIPKIYIKIIAKFKTAQCHVTLLLLNSAGPGGSLPVFYLWVLFPPQL